MRNFERIFYTALALMVTLFMVIQFEYKILQELKTMNAHLAAIEAYSRNAAIEEAKTPPEGYLESKSWKEKGSER